jgi:hypothetical protein
MSALFEFVLPAIVVMLLPASSVCKLRVGCIAYLFLQPKFWLFALHKMLDAPRGYDHNSSIECSRHIVHESTLYVVAVLCSNAPGVST